MLIMAVLYCLISTARSPENIAVLFTRALSPDTHQLKTLALKRDARRARRPQTVKKTAVRRLRSGNHGDGDDISA